MKPFDIKILAADKIFYEGQCESIILPTSQGLYGVLADHRNMFAAIVPGMIKFRQTDGEVKIASVSDGIIKIENGSVLILVDTIERPEDIDINKVKRELENVKEKMMQKQSLIEYNDCVSRLSRAINRLKTKNYNLNN